MHMPLVVLKPLPNCPVKYWFHAATLLLLELRVDASWAMNSTVVLALKLNSKPSP
jgi:hypothetical protein